VRALYGTGKGKRHYRGARPQPQTGRPLDPVGGAAAT
jgi:hypothetical protein